MKKVLLMVLLSFQVFANDDATDDLQGEYKWQPQETQNNNCYCNAGQDLINYGNIIPAEKNFNKEISQSIIDAKNINIILRTDMTRSLGADTYAIKQYSSFLSNLTTDVKNTADVNEKKTNKKCIDLDLQINNINNNIILAETKLIQLKSTFGDY